MVVSFKVSRRGRRFYPPPPASTAAAADPPPPKASPYGSPLPPPPPPPPWDATAARPGLGSGIAVRSGVHGRNGTDPADLDLEPSFALNLFPDGYSIGGLDKGMLVFLIGDDPEKKPYTRASKALLSDIEYGCLPQDILQGIPCKFQNGIVVCEVRDYRTFLSNGGDSSGHDFPKMNRVALRLGTECVIKDLSLIADPSWTYHHQLIAESTIINSLQPRLNLDPTPCLEKLCNSVKKIDLGLNKGGQRTKDTSLLNTSTGPPKKCKPKERDACEDAAVCIDNSALEVFPAGIFSSSPVNCSSPVQVNNTKSTAVSDPGGTIQRSSALRNSSALWDRKQSASSSPAPDHFLQNHEQRVELAVVQVDHKNGQSPRETVLSQKRKQSSNLPRERRPSNKSARLSFQSPKGQFQKSMGTSNKERLKMGSPNEPSVEVKLDQTIGNKDMRVQQHKTFSAIPTNRLIPSLNRNDPCLEKLPEKVKQGSQKELPSEVGVDQTMGKKDMGGHEQKLCSVIPTNQPLPSLSRNNPCSDKFPEKVKVGSQKELLVEVKVDKTICKKDIRGQENDPLSVLQTNLPHPSLNRSSLHAENIPVKVNSSHITMKERHLVSNVNLDNHGVSELEGNAMTPVTSCNASSGVPSARPNEDKASMEPHPTTSKREVSGTAISLNQQVSFKGRSQKEADIQVRRPFEDGSSVEPGVTDGTSSQFDISPDIELCIGHPFYNIEPDVEKILSEVILTTQRHALYGNASKSEGVETLRPLSSCSPSNFFRYGSAEGSPYMREETIPCYPTTRTKNTRNIGRFVFHRVQYFCRGIIDQSHYILCLLESESPDDHQIAVEMIFGDERIHTATLPTYDQARKFVDQFSLLMKRDGYTLCNSTACNGFSELRQQSGDVSQLGYLTGGHPQYQGFLPCVAKSVVINECKDTSFAFQKKLPDAHTNVLQQGSNQQWGLPGAHANVLHQTSQQWGLPDAHTNAMHQGSQQWGLPDAHANVQQQGNTQQWRLPDAHANVRQQGNTQQWRLPNVHANVRQQGSNQQWGLPGAHANVLQQGSNQQWGLPGAHGNVRHQGSNQQWGMPGAHANVLQQGSNQQWGLPGAHTNVPHPGRQQCGLPYVHANILHRGSHSQQCGLPDVHGNVLHQGRQQWGMPDVHPNVLHQGNRQWVQPGQSPTMASVDTSHFLNPSYPAEQQYNSRVLQDPRPPFSGGVCSMDQHQHQYLQNRHPGSSEWYATNLSTGSYDQWHQTPPQQHGSRIYQWGFQDFGRQPNNMPPMHAGRSMLQSASHPVGSSQMGSPTTGSDGSVTSFLVPPSYQYPPHGNGIC